MRWKWEIMVNMVGGRVGGFWQKGRGGRKEREEGNETTTGHRHARQVRCGSRRCQKGRDEGGYEKYKKIEREREMQRE